MNYGGVFNSSLGLDLAPVTTELKYSPYGLASQVKQIGKPIVPLTIGQMVSAASPDGSLGPSVGPGQEPASEGLMGIPWTYVIAGAAILGGSLWFVLKD